MRVRGWWGALLGVSACTSSGLGLGGFKPDTGWDVDTGSLMQGTDSVTGSSSSTSVTTVTSTGSSGSSTSSTSTRPSGATSTSTTTLPSTSTSTGTSTGTSTLPPEPPGPAGRYRGLLVMNYENLVPLIGGSSQCTGELELYWDPEAVPMVSGTIVDCDWPLFDVWALLTLGSVGGVFLGTVSGSDVNGTTGGGDGSFWSWDTSWEGVFDGMTLRGGFTDRTVLIDNCAAVFELEYVGP